MKRILTIIIALVLSCGFTISAEASYTTTLDLFGGIMFSFNAGTSFPADSTPDVGTQSWGLTDPAILSQINSSATYGGVLALSYDIDYNIPDWNQDYEWVLGVDVWFDGMTYQLDGAPFVDDIYEGGEVFQTSFSDTWNLGSFALADSGYTQAEVIDFLTGIPTDGYDSGIGGYLIDGNLQSGTIYAALEEGVEIPPQVIAYGEEQWGKIDWDAFEGELGGRMTLTALSDEDPVVPEPATMALFSLGFLGFAGIKKRK